MTNFSKYVAVVLVLGAGVLATTNDKMTTTINAEARFAADGAFRDGLYLGKLAAESGQPSRPAIGRWSGKEDRSMFLAGYERGYREVLAYAADGL